MTATLTTIVSPGWAATQMTEPNHPRCTEWDLDQDPIVRHAVDLLHNDLRRGWTLQDLADETHVSRATLARRFSRVVGRSPMAFLTDLRIAAAAARLLEPGATLASVARSVGYSSPFALSTVFKRETGQSPSDYRRVELTHIRFRPRSALHSGVHPLPPVNRGRTDDFSTVAA